MGKPGVSKVMFASDRTDWCTPRNVLRRVEFVGDGLIALDPCGSPENLFAEKTLLQENGDDGLVAPWTNLADGGLVFVNPPYGKLIGPWVQKCAEEAEQGAEIIALVPARTDTKWFQRACPDATHLWRGRLTFVGAKSTAPFPSALFYWGPRPLRFRDIFQDCGIILLQ